MTENLAAFPPGLDRVVRHASGQALFGRDVLSTLVDELQRAADTRRTDRNWGPGVLGCAMWMDDPELLQVLGRMANACIVVTKQGKRAHGKPTWPALTELAEKVGLLQSAYPELSELAVREADGNPIVIGPYAGDWTTHTISGVRELGFRRAGDQLVPIVHAKILLLGDMWWTDEHPSGFVQDIYGFRPRRLWIGSANFTQSSRSSLEMGLWTEDPAMLDAARKWLLALVELSEPLGEGPDIMDPELLPVEYDDAAIAEYMREVGWHNDAEDE
ncbi:hypothetical protein [Nocardioides okcheonensis]|uniref:hypothetical protein n=1 Tax=Nocardioides okcheonensis TaxID=2894081 RepID=UPI001E444D22|nr:hypothetical protein [Nocardioides okcheonensis]UFN45183.1 hypothetical protein LN652_02925 [Nocardioides okcheonensis]